MAGRAEIKSLFYITHVDNLPSIYLPRERGTDPKYLSEAYLLETVNTAAKAARS